MRQRTGVGSIRRWHYPVSAVDRDLIADSTPSPHPPAVPNLALPDARCHRLLVPCMS